PRDAGTSHSVGRMSMPHEGFAGRLTRLRMLAGRGDGAGRTDQPSSLEPASEASTSTAGTCIPHVRWSVATEHQRGAPSMRDIATAQLSGDLTRDVDLRGLPSGADVARLRVASTTRGRSGDEGGG